jgi:hypothetical protein
MTSLPDRPTAGVPYHLLDPDEEIRTQAAADDGVLLVTDRRLAVSLRGGRFDLDVPFEALRRIQFDIERLRPATLVIVPEHPNDPPVVLTVPPDQYEVVADALAEVGRALHAVSPAENDRVAVDQARIDAWRRSASGDP